MLLWLPLWMQVCTSSDASCMVQGLGARCLCVAGSGALGPGPAGMVGWTASGPTGSGVHRSRGYRRVHSVSATGTGQAATVPAGSSAHSPQGCGPVRRAFLASVGALGGWAGLGVQEARVTDPALSQELCDRPEGCWTWGCSHPGPCAGPRDLIVLKHSPYHLIFQCPLQFWPPVFIYAGVPLAVHSDPQKIG